MGVLCKNNTSDSHLYIDLEPHQLPIIYRSEYNVHFLGFEKLHPFDASKWGNVYEYLKEKDLLNDSTVTKPNGAKTNDLLLVHTPKYLKSLKWSWVVATIAEIPPLALVPNFLVQSSYLRPMRYQTGGSILAGKLALERGWAINIGGGFHHCSKEKGGGFCPYADITLLIENLLKQNKIKKAMIVDLDAHQGNGHERDFEGNSNVYILDIFNPYIYPKDYKARAGISKIVEIKCFTSDYEYLHKVERNIDEALAEFHPDIIVFNAGTDILVGDSLGLLSVSEQGIIRRDEIVFTKARAREIPIVMLTSGGYLKKTAKIIAESIENLFRKKLIS